MTTRPERPHPAEEALPEPPPLISGALRLELVLAAVLVIAALYLLPAFNRWLEAERASLVETSEVAKCQAPGEFEQLHVVIVRRGERLLGDCLYVAAPGTKP